MGTDPGLSGLEEKLQYVHDEVSAVHSKDVQVRRKAALNVGAWIYATKESVRRLKVLNRVQFDAALQPAIDTFCTHPAIDWWLLIRHKVIHDAPPGFTSSVYINHLDSQMIHKINESAPEGTVAMFLGDELGGCGWEVAGEDGEKRKVYFSLPDSIGNAEINFPNPPNGRRIEDLADEAYKLTEVLVDDAIRWAKSLQ